MKFKVIIFALTFFLSQLSYATQIMDADYFINIMKIGTPGEIRTELQKLGWFGVSDTKLYDFIEKKLLEDNAYAVGNIKNSWGAVANSVKNVAVLIRALGFSGNDKYLGLLNELNESSNVTPIIRKNIQKAIKDLPNYKHYNKTISSSDYINDKLTHEENNFVKMLRSDEIFLIDVAARRMFYVRHYHPDLVEELAQAIKRNYKKDPDDRIFTSTMRWAVKALGYSRDMKYLSLLEEVEENASRSAVSGQATSAIEQFYGIVEAGDDPFSFD